MGIMGDILDVTANGGREGIIVSAISRKANLSHYAVLDKCEKLVEAGLVESVKNDRNRVFQITEKGLGFFQEFKRFQSLVESMNLRYWSQLTQLIEPIQSKKSLGEEGILFVRNDSIFDTMVKVPLLVASMIIVAALLPIQSSFSSPRDLDLIIYPDGSTHISAEIDVDPFLTDYKVNLFGNTVDNLVVIGDDGFLLDFDIIDDTAIIETFGSSVITMEYDIHDLVSKQGRLWTFSLDSPSDFTLLLPKNSAIVGMTNLPLNMEIVNEQNQLTLSSGSTEIDYFFSTNSISTPSEEIKNKENNSLNTIIAGIAGGIIAIALVSIVVIARNRQKNNKKIDEQIIEKTLTVQKNNILDLETIFKLKPDLREDDKELVKFIFENNGEVLESELRKKFLQPRTTMWRAVKRLEREGIIEIEKKDLQNLVKLRKDMEEDNWKN